jgi:hypothetical protein
MENLKDPCSDRIVKSVKLPPARPLAADKMYPDPGILKLNHLIYFAFSQPYCTKP